MTWNWRKLAVAIWLETAYTSRVPNSRKLNREQWLAKLKKEMLRQ